MSEMMPKDVCAHCGRAPAAGYATVPVSGEYPRSVRVCHPNKPAGEMPGDGDPDCYRLVTVYGEPLGARRNDRCFEAGREAAARAIEGALDAREADGCTYIRIADVRQAIGGGR